MPADQARSAGRLGLGSNPGTDDVVNHAAAGPELDGLDPARFGQHLIRDHLGLEADVQILHVVVDPERLGQIEHQVRFANQPSARPLDRFRRVHRIAAAGARAGPADDRVDLFLAQNPLVRELPVGLLAREPGRHPLRLHLTGDAPGPGPSLLEGGQRHRRNHAAVGNALGDGGNPGRTAAGSVRCPHER